MRIQRGKHVLGQKLAQVPFCPRQISHGIHWDRALASSVRSFTSNQMGYGTARNIMYATTQLANIKSRQQSGIYWETATGSSLYSIPPPTPSRKKFPYRSLEITSDQSDSV
jgi:hypothetical protein